MQNENSFPLLDYLEGQKLRDRGLSLASSVCPDWLDRARSVAKYLAATNSETCIEEVYGIVGLPPNPNAAGAVFRGKEWTCLGIRQAMRSSRHAGAIRRWGLK